MFSSTALLLIAKHLLIDSTVHTTLRLVSFTVPRYISQLLFKPCQYSIYPFYLPYHCKPNTNVSMLSKTLTSTTQSPNFFKYVKYHQLHWTLFKMVCKLFLGLYCCRERLNEGLLALFVLCCRSIRDAWSERPEHIVGTVKDYILSILWGVAGAVFGALPFLSSSPVCVICVNHGSCWFSHARSVFAFRQRGSFAAVSVRAGGVLADAPLFANGPQVLKQEKCQLTSYVISSNVSCSLKTWMDVFKCECKL